VEEKEKCRWKKRRRNINAEAEKEEVINNQQFN
jgi:hypothetical protein